jgi:hypothetical protein
LRTFSPNVSVSCVGVMVIDSWLMNMVIIQLG